MSKKKAPSTVRESLREQIMGKREESDFNVDKREIHIMTRLSAQIVESETSFSLVYHAIPGVKKISW